MNISRHHLEAALEAADVYEDDYEIREAYSGRGMFGSTCPAVVLPTGKLPAFFVGLTLSLTEEGRGEDALRLAGRTETDSMGLGVVAYWRDAELED
jgi:hypothetical protein